MPETLVNKIDNKNIYASRAVADEDGTNIKTNYALKSEIPYVPASTSADENKVLTVASDGTPGWAASQGLFIAQYDTSTLAEVAAAVAENKIVYCRNGDRMAFLAYYTTSGYGVYEFQYYRSNADSSGTDSVFVYRLNRSGWRTTERQVKAADTVPTVSSNDDGKVLKATFSGGVGSYSWQSETGSVTYTTLSSAPTGSAINDIFSGLYNSLLGNRAFALRILENGTDSILWPTSMSANSSTTGTAVFSGSVQKTVDNVIYTEIRTLAINSAANPTDSTCTLKASALLNTVNWTPWA